MQDTVVILEEGSHPTPSQDVPSVTCVVTQRELNGRHQAMAVCARGEERSRNKRRGGEAQRITTVAFQAYGRHLEAISEFKYLGRVLTASDDSWLAVVGKLSKAWRHWAPISIILGRGGADPRTSGNFYKAME